MRQLIVIAMFLLQQAAPAATGEITGRISFRDGLPAARAVVLAVATTAPAPGRPVFTARAVADDSGNFRVGTLPPGSYTIRAQFPGAVLFYPGVVAEKDAGVVGVASGATVPNID